MRKNKTLLIIFILCALIFSALVMNVLSDSPVFFDEDIFAWSHSFKNETLTDAAAIITFFGSQVFLLPANIVLAAIFLFINKKRHYTWKVALVSLSSIGFLYLVKYIVQRPRPGLSIGEATGYSFPSGHTFTGLTFFGLISYFTLTYIKEPWRSLIIVLSVLIVIAVGWSRIYLRVHFASDVLAGFCLGIMWMIMARWFLFKRSSSMRPGRSYGNG